MLYRVDGAEIKDSATITFLCLGLGWLCHGYSQVLSDQLQKYYGKITPEITIQNILPTLQSGSTHIALYDLTKDKMYVSVARPDSQTGPDDAYDR